MRSKRIIGLVTILAGLVANPCLVGRLVGLEGGWSMVMLGVIITAQLLVLLTGILIYRAQPRTLLMIGGGLVVGLLMAEFCSYVALRTVIRHHSLDLVWHENIFSPDGGSLPYGVKPNYETAVETGEFQTTIRTNNIGAREDTDYTGQVLDVGFVGDSFTYGHGVNVGERYADYVRDQFPHQQIMVYAYASGYTVPHYYLYLKEHPEMIAKTMVLGFFAANDINEDIADSEMRYDTTGELVGMRALHRYVDDEGRLFSNAYQARAFQVLAPFHFGRLLIVAYGKLVRLERTNRRQDRMPFYRGEFSPINRLGLDYVAKLSELLKRHGSRLVVLFIPEAFQVGDYPATCPFDGVDCQSVRDGKMLQHAMRGWFAEHEIEFIDPTNQFITQEELGQRLYYASDGHWNRAGHALAGQIVSYYLQSSSDVVAERP